MRMRSIILITRSAEEAAERLLQRGLAASDAAACQHCGQYAALRRTSRVKSFAHRTHARAMQASGLRGRDAECIAGLARREAQ